MLDPAMVPSPPLTEGNVSSTYRHLPTYGQYLRYLREPQRLNIDAAAWEVTYAVSMLAPSKPGLPGFSQRASPATPPPLLLRVPTPFHPLLPPHFPAFRLTCLTSNAPGKEQSSSDIPTSNDEPVYVTRRCAVEGRPEEDSAAFTRVDTSYIRQVAARKPCLGGMAFNVPFSQPGYLRVCTKIKCTYFPISGVSCALHPTPGTAMLCWSSSGDRLSPHYIGQESYIRAPPPPQFSRQEMAFCC